MAFRHIAALAVAGGLLAGCASARPSRARPAVFEVAVANAPGPDAIATGFAVGRDRVLTVAHVLQGRRPRAPVYVRVPGDRSAGRTAAVLAVDQADDLALLGVPRLGAVAPIVDSPPRAALILVLRARGVTALPATVLALVSAQVRTPDGSRTVNRPAIELRAEVDPGDSGAPVVTRDGRVAGIVFARTDAEPEVVFATRASAASALTARR